MQRLIEIEEGRSVNFKASAFSPIAYNKLFPRRDFLRDMGNLKKEDEEMKKKKKKGEELEGGSLDMKVYELFVRIAYTFAYQGLAPTPRETEEQREFVSKYRDAWEWIDTFNTFSIYEILPEIMDLWYGNEKTISEPKNSVPAPPEK